MTNEELYEEVNRVIKSDIRQLIEADGGRIKLRKVENGIVFIEMTGACDGCPAIALTLHGGVERILKMKIEEIVAVRLS